MSDVMDPRTPSEAVRSAVSVVTPAQAVEAFTTALEPEPVRVGEWRVWEEDATVYVIDSCRFVPFCVSSQRPLDAFAIVYAHEPERTYVRYRADLAKARMLTTPHEVLDAYLASRPEEERARVGLFTMGARGDVSISVDSVPVCSTHDTDRALESLREALAKPVASKQTITVEDGAERMLQERERIAEANDDYTDDEVAEKLRTRIKPAAKPPTRTEIILARFADNERVKVFSAQGNYILSVGATNVSWSSRLDADHDGENSAEAVIARIDAALAKDAPKVEPANVRTSNIVHRKSPFVAGLEARIAELERRNDELALERGELNKALTEYQRQFVGMRDERDEAQQNENALRFRIETDHDRRWHATYNAALTGLLMRPTSNTDAVVGAQIHANAAHGERKKVT